MSFDDLDHVFFMKEAIKEAKKGLSEGGIPIGSVLVSITEKKIIGRGHNQRIQKKSAILHAEMDCIENAGRLRSKDYQNSVIYSTLSPCDMCSGAILLYKIPCVVIGENKTFMGPEKYTQERGVKLINLDMDECKQMMKDFIEKSPELWNEDIGVYFERKFEELLVEEVEGIFKEELDLILIQTEIDSSQFESKFYDEWRGQEIPEYIDVKVISDFDDSRAKFKEFQIHKFDWRPIEIFSEYYILFEDDESTTYFLTFQEGRDESSFNHAVLGGFHCADDSSSEITIFSNTKDYITTEDPNFILKLSESVYENSISHFCQNLKTQEEDNLSRKSIKIIDPVIGKSGPDEDKIQLILEITIPVVIVVFSITVCCYFVCCICVIVSCFTCLCCFLGIVPNPTEEELREARFERLENQARRERKKERKKDKKRSKDKKTTAIQNQAHIEVGNYREKVRHLSSRLLDNFGGEEDEDMFRHIDSVSKTLD